ncbi:hypothetical protein KY284_021736 [Solanum tuberosum]|nr:hypothetical protein KY284_021736 [Solanum tuberosum]
MKCFDSHHQCLQLLLSLLHNALSVCLKEWNKTCEKHSSYVKDQLLECSKLMVSFHQKAAIGRLTGVHRKYSTSKYGYTTRCEPTSFLLEAWF